MAPFLQGTQTSNLWADTVYFVGLWIGCFISTDYCHSKRVAPIAFIFAFFFPQNNHSLSVKVEWHGKMCLYLLRRCVCGFLFFVFFLTFFFLKDCAFEQNPIQCKCIHFATWFSGQQFFLNGSIIFLWYQN